MKWATFSIIFSIKTDQLPLEGEQIQVWKKRRTISSILYFTLCVNSLSKSFHHTYQFSWIAFYLFLGKLHILWLINCFVFYAVSAIFQPCNGGDTLWNEQRAISYCIINFQMKFECLGWWKFWLFTIRYWWKLENY